MDKIASFFMPQGVPAAFAADPTAGKGDNLAVITELGKGIAGAGAQIAGARQATAEAASARVAGREEANRIRAKGRAMIGAGRAATGASGTTMEGSPLAVEVENARLVELDAATAKYAAQLEATYKKTEAKQRYMGAADQFFAGITRARNEYEKNKRPGSTLLTTRSSDS